MSITSFDVEVYAIIQYGLDYIRSNLDVLDKIFDNFNSEHLKNLYGKKEIERIKTFIKDNNIPVKLAWNLTPQDIPCYSLHLAQAVEDVPHAFLHDYAGENKYDKAQPRIINSEFVPSSYDTDKGTLIVPDIVDLSLTRPGHILVDAKKEKYLITNITDKKIEIQLEGNEPDMSKVHIESFITQTRKKRGEAYFNEQIDIGIHAHGDKNTVLWLYYILVWILLRFKPEIERRCMDLTTFSASDFRRDNQFLGENIFSRWVRLSARTRVSWEEEPYPEIDTVVATVSYDDNSDN